MNLWPYVSVSAVAMLFCGYLAWISPTSKETVVALIAIVIGWWFKSPQEMMPVPQPIEPAKKEQANG